MSTFRRVHKTQSITQKTFRQIEKAIAQNRLEPGQLLVISELAEELGVSRTPVREALLILEKSGLVQVENGRMVVAGLSLSDLDEVFEFRQAIELFSIEKVVEYASEEQLQALRDILEPFKNNTGELQPKDMAATDLKFHRSLVQFTNNTRMLSAWDQMATQLQRFWDDGLANIGRVKSDIAECLAITKAVEERNGVLASELLKEHLLQTKLSLAAWQKSSIAKREATL
jgi:DNA-binding GntR family transcriptional regulator